MFSDIKWKLCNYSSASKLTENFVEKKIQSFDRNDGKNRMFYYESSSYGEGAIKFGDWLNVQQSQWN